MNEYHARAKQAIAYLLGRQILLQIFTFAGGIVLARTLGPGPFGIYVISTFLVGLFAMMGDFGLAPSFIQRQAQLTAVDIQVGFTLQQILISLMVICLWIVAPFLARWLYPDQPEVVWLVRALSINLYLTSWRTMSAVQLERELKFAWLARIEVLEVVIYQSLAVGLSLFGFKTWSFVIAAVTQGLVGTSLIYAVAPWRIRLRWEWVIVRDLLKFGIPFQLQTILNSIGGWITPILVGRMVGPIGVGYLTWASANGRKPMLLTDNIMRVGFPHISRLQGDSAEVERTVMRYTTFSILAAGLWFTGIFSVTPAVIGWIFKAQWVPATTALVWYAAVLPIDMLSMVAGMSLNGIGRTSLATISVAARSFGNVGLAIALMHWWPSDTKYNAVPVSYLIASAVTIPWMVNGIRHGGLARMAAGLAWMLVPIGASSCLGWGVSMATRHLPVPLNVLLSGSTAVVVYLGCTVLAAPGWLRILVKQTVIKRREST